MMWGVSTQLGKHDAPPATRATRPGWRDPRLWIGVALVAGSVLVGARLLGGADDTIEVWAATSDLAPGHPVQEADLTARRVRLDEGHAGLYLPVEGDLPDGAELARAVGAGELVPAGALGDSGRGLQEVPVWAPHDAVPGNLEAGAVVDVWVTPRSGEPEDQGARLVLDDVVVVAAPRSGDGLGPSGNRQVLVGVSPEDAEGVGLVLAAAKDDRVVLVREG